MVPSLDLVVVLKYEAENAVDMGGKVGRRQLGEGTIMNPAQVEPCERIHQVELPSGDHLSQVTNGCVDSGRWLGLDRVAHEATA